MAEERKYKLSHTAEEIDEKLKKIEEGGIGYTEGETVHPIDPKFIPWDSAPGGSGGGLPVIHLSIKASGYLTGLVAGASTEPTDLSAEDVAEVAKLMGHEVGIATLSFGDFARISLALRVMEMQEGDMYLCVYAFSGFEVNQNGAQPVIVFYKGGEAGDGIVIVADMETL